MKKVVLILAVAFFSLNAFSQNEEYKSTICVNTGFSLVGAILEASNSATSLVSEDPKSSALPAIQLTYDYGITKWFSMGAAFSYQMMKSDVPTVNETTMVTYTYTDKINRMNIAARFLFHYANSGKVDLYSGLRMGVTNWSFSTDNDDDTYDVGDYWSLTNNFAPQLILFGIRGYFTDNIGINAEVLSIGAPHFFSIGLSYRL